MVYTGFVLIETMTLKGKVKAVLQDMYLKNKLRDIFLKKKEKMCLSITFTNRLYLSSQLLFVKLFG